MKELNEEILSLKYFEKASDECKSIMFKTLLAQNENYKNENKRLHRIIDNVIDNDNYDSLLLIDIPEVFKDEGITMDLPQLMTYLKENKILNENEIPYAEYVQKGYFTVSQSSVITPYGRIDGISVYVTARGQFYLVEMLRESFKDKLDSQK